MAGQTITILESDITGQSATSKAVVISRAGEPDVEIPFEAGQSLNIIESGANFQLTMTGGDSQWIIESTDLVAIEARKTSLNAIIPAVGSSSGIATEATLQSILDNQTNGDQITQVTGTITATTVNTSYAVRSDSASATVTYVGKAEIGSNESSPVWQIMRITSGVSGETIEYAGTGLFDQVWANRASLTYA
jgi:hypothetical protein